MAKIRRDDTVMVITGKDSGGAGKFTGKTGKVLRVIPEKNRVVVAGVNIATKHVKNRPGIRQAGIIHVEAPLHVSNVMLVCPSCNKATRVGYAFQDDGTKARVCKRCDAVIDKPR
jgi:large subunit ribosomal protein L24